MLELFADTTYYTTKDTVSADVIVVTSDTMNNCDLIRLGDRINSKTAQM